MVHALKSNRRQECVQMLAKMARSAPRPPFGVPGLRQPSAPPGCLVRTREKRKNSRRFGVHLENPG